VQVGFTDFVRHSDSVLLFLPSTLFLVHAPSPFQGKLTLKAGTVYEGEFSRHRYHGRGLLKLQNGTYYEGEFFQGLMQGVGFRTFPDGSIYNGKFQQGHCHGRGRWFSTSDNGWLFDGLFSHGQPVDGEMTLPNGEVWHYVYPAAPYDTKGFDGQRLSPSLKRHIGDFVKGWDGHGDFTGSAQWKWADGREFRGQFVDGAPTFGRLYDTDKAWYDVQYNEGILVTDDRLKPNFKKLAPEEVEKDILFSKSISEFQAHLDSEEEAYEQMLRSIEKELETRILSETKLWVPPPPTPPPPEPDYSGFERISSCVNVSVSLRLGIDFHSIGVNGSPERAEFIASLILDLATATGTHERIFRIAKLVPEASGVLLDVEILFDPKFEFITRSSAEIAVFLLDQSKKPLSKFMRGKITKKLRSIDLNAHVYEVLKQEEEARKPKVTVKHEVQEVLTSLPPLQWSPSLGTLSWQPPTSGIGFHVGRIDIRAAKQYKLQLEAIHQFNMEQFAKKNRPPPPRVPTPEPEYLSGTELTEQIREFVAFLYAGATLKNNTMSEDEKYSTHPSGMAHPKTSHSSRNMTGKSANPSQGVVRERRDQRLAAKGLLELLGGNPDGTIDSDEGWYVQPFFDKKLAQATSTAELLWAHGGIKALVYVLRGAYPDHEFTEDLSKTRNEKERENIVKASVCKGNVDIRELASECILRACSLNPANRLRLCMKIGPHRPEGDGMLALVALLQCGPEGLRERAAAALSVVCKGDLLSKEEVSLQGGVKALLELFSQHCPPALKLGEVNRLYNMAEGRKFRASSSDNQQMRVSLMEEAQREMDFLADMRRVLENRLKRLKQAAVEALYILTTDCHDACQNMLVDGGLKVMKHTIVERRKIDPNSREGIIEIESATGIIENVCRSFFQPGVLKEVSNIPSHQACPSHAAASTKGAHRTTIPNRELNQGLLDEIDKLDLVGLLGELLEPHFNVRIQSRAAGALWAIVDGDDRYTARILALDVLPLIMKILMYGASGDQEELEARELTVGLISSITKNNEPCVNAARSLGAVARLMHLMNLGDDGLGAFSTPELAASALVQMLAISEDCRRDARRSGIRQMIKAIIDSPLLHSPHDLERQQAKSSQIWAQKLLNLVDMPPHRGEKGKQKFDESWGVAQSIKLQCNFRMHFSRCKMRQLRAMPSTLRQSLLRMETAITNKSAFQRYCALETEDGDGGHLGARALMMDVHEFIAVLKHLQILYMHAEDKHKISKTQAIAAFKSITADAQKSHNGRKLLAPTELNYEMYQNCLKRCLKMLKSEAETTGEVEEEEDRSVSPLARSGVSLHIYCF
jgi:hypothetical protein